MFHSVLIVDRSPRSLEAMLKHERLQQFVSGDIDTAENASEALSRIHHLRYDLMIVDVMRRTTRGAVPSTGMSPLTSRLFRTARGMEDVRDTIDEIKNNREVAIHDGLVLLTELTGPRYESIQPRFLLLVDRERDDGLVSFRAARKAIEVGCFNFFPKPYFTDLQQTFQRMTISFPTVREPQLYVICGSSTVGKSATLRYLQRYVPEFMLIPKYSSRPPAARDYHTPDTHPLSLFSGDLAREISWTSYGNICCIPISSIQSALYMGKDCGVAIGQVEGVRSLRRYFPQARVFFVEMEPRLISDLLERRPDARDDQQSAVSVQEEFQMIYGTSPQRIVNRNFFNVAQRIADEIRYRRGS